MQQPCFNLRQLWMLPGHHFQSSLQFIFAPSLFRRYASSIAMTRVGGLFMGRLSIAAAAAVSAIALTQIASAADLPRKAPAPPPPPVYSWTGFYVGGNAGYGWKDTTVTFSPNDALANAVTCGGGACAPPTPFNINGALGGLQAGYNWQINQNWLLGFETDFN